ncbi:MAG: endonuclease domain-containing protein [Alphaproteobacteria bacterium]|nr:endonuclease domain-containing protein [Alphaproteobacteria bacterium]
MSENAVNSKFLNISRKLRVNQTDCEKKLWFRINNKQLGVKFRRQYVIANKYIVDFICLEKKLIVELDGGQHCNNLEDEIRNRYLSDLGFEVLRFWNNDVNDNIEGCLEILWSKIKK